MNCAAMSPLPPSRPTALIAEDEPLLAAHLRHELASAWPELEVLAVCGNGPLALERALALRPQVCFLDIRMPGMTGLEVAEALAEDWPQEHSFPALVFVTAYDQYAVQAFDRQAVDYLLKPVDATRLRRCVQRLQQGQPPTASTSALNALHEAAAAASPPADPNLTRAMEQLQALARQLAPPAAGAALARLEVVQAQIGQTVHLVPVDEVIYFEAADKYLRVVTADKEHLIRLSLRELLPQLDAQRFWQIHRGTVVQVREVTSAQRDEAGRLHLHLRRRPETLGVSRLYAHLFRGM
jgi:DNA-binding LytR/AlgR family response regulator